MTEDRIKFLEHRVKLLNQELIDKTLTLDGLGRAARIYLLVPTEESRDALDKLAAQVVRLNRIGPYGFGRWMEPEEDTGTTPMMKAYKE